MERLENLRHILLRSSRSSLPQTDTKISSSLTSACIASAPAASLSEPLSQSETSSQSQQECKIAATPQQSMFDEEVQISVLGVGRHAKVTLQALVRSQWRKKEVAFVSYAHFYADELGNLDLNVDPAFNGTYTGVDPAGLLWSMRPLPGHPQDVRLVIRDVTRPLDVTIAVFRDHITPDDESVEMTSPNPLCVTQLQRRIMAPGVKRIPIREGRIRGTLFLPPGKGAHPGVIDMFGASGGITEIRAALLSAQGFTVLSLAFFNFEDLPTAMRDAQFDYFEEAVSWLCKHPCVKADGIGVVGVSRGAILAMQMAMHCPQVKAVVEINGPPFQIVHDLLRCGQVFYPAVKSDVSKMIILEKEGFISKDFYVVTDADYFPLWKCSAHILCLACQDDQQAAWEHTVHLCDLYPCERRHLIDVIVYKGAGHLLEPPYTPHCRYCYNPVAGGNILWGGEPKAHALAQLDAWKRTINFLQTWLCTERQREQGD